MPGQNGSGCSNGQYGSARQYGLEHLPISNFNGDRMGWTILPFVQNFLKRQYGLKQMNKRNTTIEIFSSFQPEIRQGRGILGIALDLAKQKF